MTTSISVTKRSLLRAVASASVLLTLLSACGSPSTGQRQAAAPSRYNTYYRYLDTGPAEIPFHDSPWVPQGLTKLGESRLVISYYDATGCREGSSCPRAGNRNSIIAIIERSNGALVKYLNLGFRGHVGGLAMTSNFLWVANDGKLVRYAKSALNQRSGTTIRGTTLDVAGLASYAFAEGESVWTGTFDSNSSANMVRYKVLSDGRLSVTGGAFRTPCKVQGVAIAGDKIVWSQSYGRDNDSKLIVWRRSRGGFTGSCTGGTGITAPNMSEGLVIANNELQVLFESGSSYYADADYRIRSVHHGSFANLPYS